MTTTDPQPGQISQVVFSIVSKGRENGSLSSLTPRLVRSEVENVLGLPKGTLDVPKYREIVKHAIKDAMQFEQTPLAGASASEDKKERGSSSARKTGESGPSSPSKSARSKEANSDSDSAAEPTLFPSRSNVKSNISTSADEKSKPVRPNSKAKASNAICAAAKLDTKAAQSGPKRKRASAPIVQSNNGPAFSDTKRRASSSSRNLPDDNKIDSEASSPVDEPVKKKNRRKSVSSDTGKSKAKMGSPASYRPRQQLATMTAHWDVGQFRNSPASKMQRRPEDIVDLSAEIHHLETDIAEHPFPDSTRPRQAPAMTRYRGAPPRPQATPKDKKRRPHRSRRKPAAPTNPDVASLTKPDVPLHRSDEVPPQTQHEVIDLTGDD